MTFVRSAVLWLGPHPGWCLGFPPFPHWDSRHSPKPRKRPTPCSFVPDAVILVQLPYSCGVLDHAQNVLLSVTLQKMRNCLRIFLIAHLLWFCTTSPIFSPSQCLFFIVWCQFVCASDSLLMRVLYCLSASHCELLCFCLSSTSSRK